MQQTEKQIAGLFIRTAIEQAVGEIEDNRKAFATETSCGHIVIDDGEAVQVVIKIIRGKDNWLGDFDIIEHVNL